MGDSRKKIAAVFDLFQAPPPAPRAQPAPEPSLDLFARPPGKPAPGRPEPAPKPPRAPSAPPRREENVELFKRPPAAPKAPAPPQPPAAPPRAPERAERPAPRRPAQPAPRPPEGTPGGFGPLGPPRQPQPRQPQPPPAPPAAPRSAPAAPGRQVDIGEETGALRQSQDFKEFLRQKYEAGRADISHPDPQKRRRNPTIKFWTAMKYDTFKEKVKREFQAWLQEAEGRRPRVEIGARVLDISGLRAGDFLEKSWGPKYKVLRTTPSAVVVMELDHFGRPVTGQERRLTPSSFQQNRIYRRDEIRRPDVPLEQAKAYIDEKHGHPPREVKNKQDYAKWLEEKLIVGRGSPFYRLGDDEARHKEQLKKHIEKILEERGVGDDWEWGPPSRAQVGQRAQYPLQLHAGDFVQYYNNKYRVISVEDEKVHVVPVDDIGRPRGSGTNFNKDYLFRYPVTRIEAVQRPDVSTAKAKEFADQHLGFPPRNVNSRTEYANWLDTKFRTKTDSPYQGLGSDETEHKNALEKQIKKILEDRGIDADWEWEAPPEVAVGERVANPFQLRKGQFFSGGTYYDRNGKYKVLDIHDNGEVEYLRVDDNGVPQRQGTLQPSDFQGADYKRINEVKRPEVSDEKVKQLADLKFADPGRSVTNRDKYRKWLLEQLIEDSSSPYYKLQDNEGDARQKLEQQVDKILEARGVGEDWEWSPPPPITFPVAPDWESKQDELMAIAREGQRVGGDRGLGGGINGAVRRKMELGGKSKDYVFKSKHKEPGQPGSSYSRQLPNKTGIPSGTMHNREQAAYELDRLLGPGTVIPPTASAGEGEEELGAYQSWVDGMETFANSGYFLNHIPTEELLRHQDVGRLLVMDVLMGHQDRHHGNIGFSWVDPNAPRTARNLRIHGIDNGYALAETKSNQKPYNWDIRDAWNTTGSGRTHLIRDYFDAMPQDMQDRLNRISTKDVAEALKKAGIKKASVIEAVAVRLAVLKNSPEVIYAFISQSDSVTGQQRFQYESHHKPEELIRTQTDLDPSTYADIQRDVAEALRG